MVLPSIFRFGLELSSRSVCLEFIQLGFIDDERFSNLVRMSVHACVSSIMGSESESKLVFILHSTCEIIISLFLHKYRFPSRYQS